MRENRGLAVAIAITAFALLVTLPFAVPSTIWVVLFVYAIVKAVGSAPEQADPFAIVLAIVVVVTFFTLALAVAVSLLGRAMSPKRQDRRA
jgi:quinol-cytochrome oxidoreductase complex cytochrome b subunit